MPDTYTDCLSETDCLRAVAGELLAALRGVLRESDRRTDAYDRAHRAAAAAAALLESTLP